MRMLMACAATAVLFAACAEAQDHVAAGKNEVTDTKIIDICGSRLSKMFNQFGVPVDVLAIRGDTPDEDDVICDYGTFMFRVRDRMVRRCFFRKEWKGPVHGIKIGDSREDVVKVLGTAPMTFKDKNGVVTDYGYRLKDLDVEFYANFDENGKLKRVEISPL
jgi:hypothetical protein